MRSGVAVLLAVLVVSATGGVVAADGHADAVPREQVIEGDGGLAVWERAVFPLRVDYDTAATSVPNAALDVDPPNEGPIPLNRGTLGVFDPGANVTAEFEERTGAESLENERLTFVLARVDGSTSAAFDLFEDPSVETLNGVGEFEAVDRVTTDRFGRADVTVSPETPGEYVLFAATNSGGAGLTVTDGNVSVDGEATVVGLDFLVVQAGNSTVTDATERVAAGENATFEVVSGFNDTESGTAGGEATAGDEDGTGTPADDATEHTVVLYDERTFVGQRVVLAADEGSLSPAGLSVDTAVRSTVSTVDGVATTRGDATVGAAATGLLTLDGFTDDLGAAIVGNDSTLTGEPIGDATLYASTTVVDGTDNESIAVVTKEGWRPGPYRYVHVAERGGEIRTTTGQVVVLPAQAQGGDDGDPGRDGRGNGPENGPVPRMTAPTGHSSAP